MAKGRIARCSVQEFSRIKDVGGDHPVLRLRFDFVADEDRSDDLRASGLVLFRVVRGVRSEHPVFQGTAYIRSDSEEDLRSCQEKLRERRWTEMAEE